MIDTLLARTLATAAALLASSALAPAQDPAVPIRLADLLPTAKIESPLTGVAAASGLEALGEVRRETILAEDFEDFDAREAGWSRAEDVVRAAASGKACVLRSLGRSPIGWVFPVEPSTHYVFERRVSASQPLDIDFAVVEAKRTGRIGIRSVFDRHYMAGRGQALKVHYAPRPVPNSKWQRTSTSFFTTPGTRSLAVIARPTISQQESVQAEHEKWFDDIRLERVHPTPEQEIALMKARSLADGADPVLGMAKFGQFPPLGDVRESHGPWDDNYSYSRALYVPPPTDVTFSVKIPKSASLYFSVSLSRETRPGDSARFDVLARLGNREQTLWSHKMVAAEPKWGWHYTRINLASFAGETIDLVLRTRAEKGHPHPVWGNPEIDVAPGGEGPRNVILIAVDTLRADRLSCYGYGKKTTPNIDALAGDGVRFDQVASNCNWTCPSFASIFTGLWPSRHGVFSYGPRTPLAAGLRTIGERFRDAGWTTHFIAYKPPLYDGGFGQGFNVAFNVPREAVRGSDNLAEALLWLERNADRRNFLFLHFNDPHQPFTQPPPYDRKFGDDPAKHGFKIPISTYSRGSLRGEGRRKLMRSLYDGEVLYVDHQIGAFLNALKKRGLYDGAVIGFVSDHGEQLWEHGGFGHGPSFGNSATLLHDEVIRVPLIVKPPVGTLNKTGVVATQVRGFDIMPTLLELGGIEVEGELDAQSLIPLMASVGAAKAPPDRLAVIETSGRAIAVRSQQWKYILSWSSGRGSGREILYDLQADPAEKENLARSKGDDVAKLRAKALGHLLRNRPGRYLVVIGKTSTEPREVRVSGVASAVSFFGLKASRAKDLAVTFSGEPSHALHAVASLEIPDATSGAITVDGDEYGLDDFRRYSQGELDRLVKEQKPGVHLFEGPVKLADIPASLDTMDARQLEALRALGYMGAKKEAEGKEAKKKRKER